ncbi:disease resistance RPP13-like protein 4 [Magnolia sinica]|uniref:disease resistance RPP13-like protein 4 n=1 Tax=Magnolia sinica TaxID=86752 RepID=UPI00265A61A2|nr:disease resistance RPP13-like protein 4 [Magnolia sinica]
MTMVSKMTAKQRKMAFVRQEISEIFTWYERSVNYQLGEITREAQDIIERLETIEGIDKNAEAMEHDKKKLEEKMKEMEGIKTNVEACLRNLTPNGPRYQGSASKGKEKAAGDVELESKWPKMDTAEEEAAIKSKEDEFKGLREQLKLCMLCFSIFPMDADIQKRVLIYWWIGEGFVMAKEEKTSEEVGEDCFKELVDRDFIHPIYNRHRPNILRCKLHPSIHRMIIALSRKEEFFNLTESDMQSSSPSKARRACLMTKNKDGQLDEEYCLKLKEPTLLTLFNINVKHLKLNFGIKSMMKLKTLVVLQLGNWRGSTQDHMEVEEPNYIDHYIEIEEPQILDRLSALVHLRYLSLRGISKIKKLPSSIRSLRNLEILDLNGCQDLEELTEGIKWLEKLTHLDVSDCYMLEHMPKGLGSLSELTVLKGFVFCGSVSCDQCKMRELVRLEKLKKLSISIRSGADSWNIDLQDLIKIKALRSLAITWRKACLMNLKLPPGLVKLDLQCFPQFDQPSWLNLDELPSLEKLYIRGGKLAKLRLEGNGWKIKMLRFKFLKELELRTADVRESLPQLEYLEIYKCPKIEVNHQLDEDGVWVKEKLVSASYIIPPASLEQ